MVPERLPLPIDPHLREISSRLQARETLVLRAPPGAGKTTRVPAALLDAGFAAVGLVLLVEPRRIAACAAAARIATERGTPLGEEVGYEVRFDRRAGRQTRLLAVTDGVLLRKLAADPFLSRAAVVVFDEFHERRLESDLALALLRRLQAEVRPDLRLVIMSATLELAPLAAWLGGAEVIESEGRQYPVEVRQQPSPPRSVLPRAMARAIVDALGQSHGDVLAFLPGLPEIRRTRQQLAPWAAQGRLIVQELYGDMPLAEQQAVLQPTWEARQGGKRRVVLATNVAEASVTVEGVTAVVDCGWLREARYDARLGFNRLETVRISRASAAQRAGRAGRLAPGLCLRLWSEREHQGLPEFQVPEVRRLELSSAVLQLLAVGETDVLGFPWYEPPPPQALEHALALLERLGAVAENRITPLGQIMAAMPLEPRLARLLVEAHQRGHAERGALAAALLSERVPFRDEAGPREQQHCLSDVLERVAAIEAVATRTSAAWSPWRPQPAAAQRVLRAARQMARLVRRAAGPAGPPHCDADEALLRAVAAAFPDRVARRRAAGSRRAVMVGGRGVRLAAASGVVEPELFVCVELDERGGQETLVRLASGVQAEWLPAHLISTHVETEFDSQRQRVLAWRRTRYAGLVIAEAAVPVPPQASQLLAEEVARRWGKELRPRPEEEAWMARIELLRQHMPELGLPEPGPDAWLSAISLWCQGKTSLAELRHAPLLDALKAAFTPQQLAQIEREAPERLLVPSGSRIRVRYVSGRPPVLAVRIQELFGLRDTPRLCRGRVPVVLELLAPNERPQQVTTDLASFWAHTYPKIRKELARRYPKHAWPEDPLTAVPTRRPQRRS